MRKPDEKPMPWYWMSSNIQRHNNYIFWKDAPGRVIREKYRHLVCAGCRKIDEDAALSLGFDPDLRIRASSDFVATIDGMICVRNRFMTVLEEHQISGLEFTPLPDGNYFLVQPRCRLEVDLSKAGFQYEGEQCQVCGRYRGGAYVGPVKGSYQLPSDDSLICAPTALPESCISRQMWLLASVTTKSILKANKMTGIQYTVAS